MPASKTLVVLPSSGTLLLNIIRQKVNQSTSILSSLAVLCDSTLAVTVLEPDTVSLVRGILTAQPEIIELGHLVLRRDFKTREGRARRCGGGMGLCVGEQAIRTDVDLLTAGDFGVEVEETVS